MRVRYGMGYSLNGRTCSWGGWGGSIVMVDFDARMTLSYVMNQMLEEGLLGDDRGLGIVLAAYNGFATLGRTRWTRPTRLTSTVLQVQD